MIALNLAMTKGSITEEEYFTIIDQLKEIPVQVEKVLECNELVGQIAEEIKEANDMFYLGRGVDYSLAMEGALKIKEISYVHAEVFDAGELKHGSIALIDKGTLVVAIATQRELFEKMVSNM